MPRALERVGQLERRRPRRRGRVVHSQQACATRDCGRCPACRLRRLWAEGRFDKSGESKWWEWRDEEIALLRQLAGQMQPQAIAEQLTTTFGVPRTKQAVQRRAHLLGLSLWQDGLTVPQIMRLFRTSRELIVERWVKPGYLVGRASGETDLSKVVFAESAVEAFVRAYPWLYDWRRMRPGHRLTAIAEVVGRTDPWVDAEAAAAFLGLSLGGVYYWVAQGLIPHRRRFHGKSREGGIVVRADDLPAVHEAIAAEKRARLERRAQAAQAGYASWLERQERAA